MRANNLEGCGGVCRHLHQVYQLWRNITGMCRSANGDKYSGQWEAGRRQGVGGCMFASGDKYRGEWLADQRSGKGMCEYANGDIYQGTSSDAHMTPVMKLSLSCVISRRTILHWMHQSNSTGRLPYPRAKQRLNRVTVQIYAGFAALYLTHTAGLLPSC